MSLPILWIIRDDDEDEKLNELLGIKENVTNKMGIIKVNPQHIVAYNASKKPDNVTLRLADGEIYTIHLSISEFEKALYDFYAPIILNEIPEGWVTKRENQELEDWSKEIQEGILKGKK